MATPLVPDELWEIVEPLLPAPEPKPRGGRPRVSDRAAFTGILFVLRTGLPWNSLPAEMGCGSGSTCFRRFGDWTRRGLWDALHRAMLARLGRAGRVDWSHAVIDSASVRAVLGGRTPAPARWTGPNAAASGT
jgi:transposase